MNKIWNSEIKDIGFNYQQLQREQHKQQVLLIQRITKKVKCNKDINII